MIEKDKPFYLFPSALYVSEKPMLITTVLGSCVAVCLWDPNTEIGGMNHFMLPFWNGKGLASPKYGNIAIDTLINKMVETGVSKANIVAKIFGGGAVLNDSSVLNIGARNIRVAQKVLKENNINILSYSVGGNLGRKIIFNTKTGEIRHRFIKKTRM